MRGLRKIPLRSMGVLPQCIGEMPQVVRDSRHNLVNQNALQGDPPSNIWLYRELLCDSDHVAR